MIRLIFLSNACGIELEGKFIVTGGNDGGSRKTVAEFSVTGHVKNLTSLLFGRSHHACAKFVDKTGKTVSINPRPSPKNFPHQL